MTGKPTLYWMPESPPCRTVWAVCQLLGIDLDLKRVDLFQKEQLSPEFLKINPFHVVPTFVDQDGFTLWESRAIAAYLVQSRKPDSALYPVNDVKRRAIIDQCLQFDLGTLYRAISDIVYPVFRGSGQLALDKLPRYHEVLAMLEKYLEQRSSDYMAGGTEMSLADLSIYFSLTLAAIAKEMDLTGTDYQRLSAWRERIGRQLELIDKHGILKQAAESIKQFAMSKMQPQ